MQIDMFQSLTNYDLNGIYRVISGQSQPPLIPAQRMAPEQGLMILGVLELKEDLSMWQDWLPEVRYCSIGLSHTDCLIVLFFNSDFKSNLQTQQPLWAMPVECLPVGTFAVVKGFVDIIQQQQTTERCKGYLLSFCMRGLLEDRQRLNKFIQESKQTQELKMMMVIQSIKQTEHYGHLLRQSTN